MWITSGFATVVLIGQLVNRRQNADVRKCICLHCISLGAILNLCVKCIDVCLNKEQHCRIFRSWLCSLIWKIKFYSASAALTRTINAKQKLNNSCADNILYIEFSFLVQLQNILLCSAGIYIPLVISLNTLVISGSLSNKLIAQILQWGK